MILITLLTQEGLLSYFGEMETSLSSSLRILGSAMDWVPSDQRVPLYLSPVVAGFPSPADDFIDGEINLHELLVRNPPATFFVRAVGESMLGAGIHDGDLLIVDRSAEASSGRVIIAALDGELTIKRLTRRKGRVLLLPENPAYSEIDITEREYVHIWGVVTYVVHKL